jgi:hypothetical protein
MSLLEPRQMLASVFGFSLEKVKAGGVLGFLNKGAFFMLKRHLVALDLGGLGSDLGLGLGRIGWAGEAAGLLGEAGEDAGLDFWDLAGAADGVDPLDAGPLFGGVSLVGLHDDSDGAGTAIELVVDGGEIVVKGEDLA